jgi:hypothetical protein
MMRAGHTIQVQFVLTATRLSIMTWLMIYPDGRTRPLIKIQHGYLWKGSRDANSGHCLLVWSKVTWPKKLGGPGILSLELRVRWM